MMHGRTPLNAAIVICTHNAACFLPRAIDSALAQRYRRGSFEVIVVDDGSTDETAEVLKRYGDDLRVIAREREGLPAACNAGISACRGDLLLRLDADDEMVPGALDKLAGALSTTAGAVMAIANRLEIFVREGVETAQAVRPGNLFDVIAPGVMYKVSALRDIGGYRDFYWEEYDLYMRLKGRGEIAHVDEILYRYYLHGQNMTASADARFAGWEALIAAWGIERLRELGESKELEESWQRMSTAATPDRQRRT